MDSIVEMKPIEPPDTHHLSAAIGWLGLGDAGEAEAELALISAAQQTHPDVLEARWAVCAERKAWTEALDAARALVEAAPDSADGWLHLAYALRRAPDGSVKRAWDALLPVARKFPKEPIVPFNLACYACQMQDLETARQWLKRALSIGNRERIKSQALADPDLEALWEEIGKM
jgi:tetratricopeptide (TPR) repeat protein